MTTRKRRPDLHMFVQRDPRDVYEAAADRAFRCTTLNAARCAIPHVPELAPFFAFLDGTCLDVREEYALIASREGAR